MTQQIPKGANVVLGATPAGAPVRRRPEPVRHFRVEKGGGMGTVGGDIPPMPTARIGRTDDRVLPSQRIHGIIKGRQQIEAEEEAEQERQERAAATRAAAERKNPVALRHALRQALLRDMTGWPGFDEWESTWTAAPLADIDARGAAEMVLGLFGIVTATWSCLIKAGVDPSVADDFFGALRRGAAGEGVEMRTLMIEALEQSIREFAANHTTAAPAAASETAPADREAEATTDTNQEQA